MAIRIYISAGDVVPHVSSITAGVFHDHKVSALVSAQIGIDDTLNLAWLSVGIRTYNCKGVSLTHLYSG